jgi:hypothetical protein
LGQGFESLSWVWRTLEHVRGDLPGNAPMSNEEIHESM